MFVEQEVEEEVIEGGRKWTDYEGQLLVADEMCNIFMMYNKSGSS